MAWWEADNLDEESNEEDEVERQRQLDQQQHERLNEAGTLDGLKDLILDALPLVDEVYDMLSCRSAGLQRYRAVLAQAARNLSDENWQEFLRKPMQSIYLQDDKVFDRLMTDAEPLWRRMMELTVAFAAQAKRQQSNALREYLYICTGTPRRELLGFFHNRSWKVVRQPPTTSFQHLPKAGSLDGPPGYPLAAVDLSFSLARGHASEEADAELEDVEDVELEDHPMGPEEVRQRSSSRSSCSSSRSSRGGMPQWLAEALMPNPANSAVGTAPLAHLPLHSSGLGKIGVSRSRGVRQRLQLMQGALAEALQCLAPGGVMVISWCGLPVHPILPFLAQSLRPAFRRVHVLAPPEIDTYETYILAVEYDSEGHNSRPDPVLEFPPATEDETPASISKFAFYDWLRSPIRRSSGYDDAVAWTLPQKKLQAECLPQYQNSGNPVRRMSNYNRPWLTAMTGSQQKTSLDPEARCDEMWSLYAEKLRLLANRLEEGSVSLESLPPKPPYRVNATTRWGLAPSRLPLDMPSDAAAQLVAESKGSKGAKRSGSKSSKRSGSKRPKSKEPPSKVEPAPAAPPAPPAAAGPATVPETPVAPAVPAVPPVVVPVPAVPEPMETSSATDSSEAVDPVAPVAPAVPVEAEMPEASQFSEEDFLKAYQQPDRRNAPRRARVPGTVSGRTPKTGTMWMSSTLGGASGIGPDIVSMMRRSSFLRGTFEKINLADQSSLPDLYKAAWPMPNKRLATGLGAHQGVKVESRPLSATRAMPVPALGSRPHSTATRRPKPLLTPTDTRPSSAGTMPVHLT